MTTLDEGSAVQVVRATRTLRIHNLDREICGLFVFGPAHPRRKFVKPVDRNALCRSPEGQTEKNYETLISLLERSAGVNISGLSDRRKEVFSIVPGVFDPEHIETRRHAIPGTE